MSALGGTNLFRVAEPAGRVARLEGDGALESLEPSGDPPIHSQP